MCQVAWKTEVPKQWQTSVLIYSQKRRRNALTTGAFFYLVFLERSMQSASKKEAVKWLNLNFRMHNVDFVLEDPPWTRSLPFSKFLKNCGNMPKRCIQGGAKVTRQSKKIKNFTQTLPVSYLSINFNQVYAKVRSFTCPWTSINQSVSYLSMKKYYIST